LRDVARPTAARVPPSRRAVPFEVLKTQPSHGGGGVALRFRRHARKTQPPPGGGRAPAEFAAPSAEYEAGAVGDVAPAEFSAATAALPPPCHRLATALPPPRATRRRVARL
jgi:hypothetical protein